MKYDSRYERLVANTVEDEDGCWIWTGRVTRGYPVFSERIEGQKHPATTKAHRAMLEEVTGYEFPFDQAGHYRCFKPLCIRPDCLRIETQAENLSTRRGYAECDGCWIPTLFPTKRKQLQDEMDAFIDRVLVL